MLLLPSVARAGIETNALKGQVAQSQAVQKPLRLQGAIEQQELAAEKESAESDKIDPDLSDKELMIQWDRWRNRFLQAVLSGTSDVLNCDQAENYRFNPKTHTTELKYPMGTVAWFSCKITRDGQVSEVLIDEPSGFPVYDEAVREAVQALAGSEILKFPYRSRRKSILQAGGVQRTTQISKEYFHFGDVEHYRVHE